MRKLIIKSQKPAGNTSGWLPEGYKTPDNSKEVQVSTIKNKGVAKVDDNLLKHKNFYDYNYKNDFLFRTKYPTLESYVEDYDKQEKNLKLTKEQLKRDTMREITPEEEIAKKKCSSFGQLVWSYGC